MDKINPYLGYKVYGPYLRKDGRQHVILFKSKNDKITVSYPRYLMEMELGRLLRKEEDVHHLDGNVSHNEISNFKVINKHDHIADHRQKYDIVKVKCFECEKEFILDPIQNRDYNSNKRNKETVGPFCSKQCSGVYGKKKQLGL